MQTKQNVNSVQNKVTKKYQQSNYLVSLFFLLFLSAGSVIADEYGYCSTTVKLPGATKSVNVELSWQAKPDEDELIKAKFNGNKSGGFTTKYKSFAPNALAIFHPDSDPHNEWLLTKDDRANKGGLMDFYLQDTNNPTPDTWIKFTSQSATCYVADSELKLWIARNGP